MRGSLKFSQRRRRFKYFFPESPPVDQAFGPNDNVFAESSHDRAIALAARLRLLMSDLVETDRRGSRLLKRLKRGRLARSYAPGESHDEMFKLQEGLFRCEYFFMRSRSSSVKDSRPEARILSRIRSTSAIGSSRRFSASVARAARRG